MLGEVIHGYRIDQALPGDKGGFGDVYFATHVDSGAEAVVKVLKPEMSAQRDIVARFFNEARAAASVHHPGVVQIHNVGYHSDRAYLLMERLHGDDLETRLASGPLPVDRAIVFLRQAAGAIGAAHDRGIVHRDLKPANLFVVADPDVIGGERVKVLDFGIAKLTLDAGAGKTQGVFGTPAYMSPEQCASTGAVDGRADLYSLGCIFYELVTGRPPFGPGGIELIASHLRDTPPPPRAIAPWLPPAVEQVILWLLEKPPERRPPTCAALIAALDEAAAASGLPGASGAHLALSPPPVPASAAYRVPQSTTLSAAAGASTVTPSRRSRGVWLGIGAVVVVAAAIAAVLAVPARHPAGGGSGSAGSNGSAAVGSNGGALIAPPDAALIAVAPDAPTAAPVPDAAIAEVVPDAAEIAAAAPDAMLDSPPDSRSRPPRTHTPPTSSREDDIARRTHTPPASSREDDTAPRNAGDDPDALAQSARSEVRAGRYDRALALYRRAYEIVPQPATLLAIGTMEFQLGRCVDARRTLQRIGPTWPKDPAADTAERLLARIGACRPAGD